MKSGAPAALTLLGLLVVLCALALQAEEVGTAAPRGGGGEPSIESTP